MSYSSKIFRAFKMRYLVALLGTFTLLTLASYLVTISREDKPFVALLRFPNSASLNTSVSAVRTSQEHMQNVFNNLTISSKPTSGPKMVENKAENSTFQKNTIVSRSFTGDQQFLDQLLDGHWSPRTYTTRELEELEAFIDRTRTHHKLPKDLQRADNKCGNVNFPGHQWYRAVCNPKGVTPCCFNNSCSNKTVQECQCAECYDMRQQIHAELATWIPNEVTVKMSRFRDEIDVCPVLRNKTIYFIGDSYMRQLYTALLAILRDKNPRHVLKEDVSEAVATKCDKYYRYFADCRYEIIFNTEECNRTVKLKMDMSQKISQAGTIFRLMKELRGKHNSWVLLGIGFHDHLDFESLKNKFLNPLIKLVSNSSWPNVIWLPIHSPGLLKTPLVETQTAPAILAFNVKVKAHLDAQPITLLDFTKLTNGTMSYDGSHYGRGINEVKIQVLLNYFKKLQR